MQVFGQRCTDTTFDFADLSQQYFIIDNQLYLVFSNDVRLHVFHSLSHRLHLRRHTVAHANPCLQEILLCEGIVLLLIRDFRLSLLLNLLLTLTQLLEGDAQRVELDMRPPPSPSRREWSLISIGGCVTCSKGCLISICNGVTGSKGSLISIGDSVTSSKSIQTLLLLGGGGHFPLSGSTLLARLLLLNVVEKFPKQGFQTLRATPRARHIGIVGLRELSHLNERQLHKQALMG